jgi:hypothetical protein
MCTVQLEPEMPVLSEHDAGLMDVWGLSMWGPLNRVSKEKQQT